MKSIASLGVGLGLTVSARNKNHTRAPDGANRIRAPGPHSALAPTLSMSGETPLAEVPCDLIYSGAQEDYTMEDPIDLCALTTKIP